MRARTMCKSGAVGLATGAVVLTLAAPGGAVDTDFGDDQSGHGFGRMGPPNARTTSVSPSSGADFEMPFKCGQAWTGTSRSGHSPSYYAIKLFSTNLGDEILKAAASDTDVLVSSTRDSRTGTTALMRPGCGVMTITRSAR